MSLTASASVFVVFLLSVQVIQGQNGWGVTYTSTEICASKGSTVEMSCTYTYPLTLYGSDVTVQKTFWFTTKREYVDLTSDSEYSGRVQYICDNNKCTLRITDLRESDSAEYKFRFITDLPAGKYTGSPGVTLSVTDLQVRVSSYRRAECHSSYRLPDDASYIWYKNGQKVQAQTSSYIDLNTNDYENSYSCAVNRCEDLVSPPVCVHGQNCKRVTYTDRSICAFKGSSVDISCTYNSYHRSITSKFWFTPERSDQWQSPSQPEDLSEDSLYAGRVQVFETKRGRSTLRITDLRESDSAQYHFKFKTPRFEWMNILPGTTLTVTALQVQVNTISVQQYYTEAELKCHSSCSPAGHLSYVWFKNGQKVREETSSYKDWFDHEDFISCALKGHENYGSPSVCVHGQNCNRVTYTDRSICASKGSSVYISWAYNSYDGSITSKFWFSPERSDQWQSPSQPAGRVQVFDTERGRSTLRITDLRESDSAQYHFKFKTPSFEWMNISPGTTLTVTALQVQVNTISVTQNNTEAELKCHSSCSPAGRLSYVWFKNGQKVTEETSSYKDWFDPEDFISCALKGHENYGSPSVYAPKLPSVSVSPSAEIVENSSLTLTCSSDANPAAKYTWYKKNGDPDPRPLSKEAELVFRSIQSSDSGEYYCTAENELRRRTSESISIDVKYAPRLPSVSVSPSGEIVEGSSVNLTCSSDANPAAKYTWYKENEDSPKASGQIFTITDFRLEHRGNYYCEAQNGRGRHNSTLHLIVVAGSVKSVAVGSITAVVLAIIFLCAFLLIRKKFLKQTTVRPDNNAQLNMGTVSDNHSAAVQRTPAEQQDDLCYASVSYSKQQEEPLYSNVRPVQPNRHKNEEQEEEDEDSVEYSVINLKTGSASSESRRQDVVQDPSAVYSMVTRTPRV